MIPETAREALVAVFDQSPQVDAAWDIYLSVDGLWRIATANSFGMSLPSTWQVNTYIAHPPMPGQQLSTPFGNFFGAVR